MTGTKNKDKNGEEVNNTRPTESNTKKPQSKL